MLRDHVGNDVVDLDEPLVAEHHLNERFLARVCAPEERSALTRSADPKLCLWGLFAAKEAAFKLAVKRFGPRPFAHRRFVVAADFTGVRHHDEVFPLALATGPGWVHALVSTTPSAVFRVELCACESPSAAARRVLTDLVAAASGCDGRSLHVERPRSPGRWDGLGPPRLLRDGRPTGTDVSLSHDGRFVAAAAVHCA